MSNHDLNAAASEAAFMTRTRDYRDELRVLLNRAHNADGTTRYKLCKQMGIDSGTLSNVLAKRRHFSLERLDQILGLLGYRIGFEPAPERKPKPAPENQEDESREPV